MKITQKRLRQLIKEELDAMSGGMDPKNAIIGAFEGIPTEKLPPEERLVSLGYGLSDVFGDGPEGTKQEMKSFYRT